MNEEKRDDLILGAVWMIIAAAGLAGIIGALLE